MNKINIPVLNLDYYKEILPNGLEVIICPNYSKNKVQVYYEVKFGDYYTFFKGQKDSTYLRHRLGRAHFLEHKLFEQRDGSNSFAFFEEHALSNNAMTSNNGTWYFFEACKDIELNINYLLDMVDDLYLTDENVKKEKGIILSEQRMGSNNPGRQIAYAINNMIYKNHPTDDAIIGSPDDIKSITKEELTDIYNTFYVPNNMQLIVVGNVVPEKIIEIVKENQSKKKRVSKTVQVKKYTEEPAMVMHENTAPVFTNSVKTICIYKIMLPEEYVDNTLISYFAKYICFLLTSGIHGYNESLREQKIISASMIAGYDIVDNFLIITIKAIAPDEKIFADTIHDKLKNLDKDINDYEFYKQNELCNMIKASDGNNFIMYQLLDCFLHSDHIDNLEYQHFKESTYDDFLKFYHSLSFEEHGVLHVVPKQKEE